MNLVGRVFRLFWFVLLAAPALAEDAAIPLPRAHAHNDYEHDRPLLDALENGFCSVEADIWLIDGELLVAHDREDASPDRTLKVLYLEPLQERAAANDGRIYPGGPEFTLLIDIKSDAESTYAKLREQLMEYPELITTFEGDVVTPRAVRAIVSGARPLKTMLAEDRHYAAYDGRPGDLDKGYSAAFMPLVSDSWGPGFTWRGRGPMPSKEREALETLLRIAHEQGRRVRFWAIPHREEFWDVIHEAGVDLINADNLSMLRDYLVAKERQDD